MGALPTNAYGEGSFGPVPAGHDGHFPAGVGARSVKYLVRMSMFSGVELVRMGMGGEAIVGMRKQRHGELLGHGRLRWGTSYGWRKRQSMR